MFHASEEELRHRAVQVRRHLEGGAGTVMMFYSSFVLSWFTILKDDDIDLDTVRDTKRKLMAFQHSECGHEFYKDCQLILPIPLFAL